MSANQNTIFIAAYEIPEDHGSHFFTFSADEAKKVYNKFIENAEAGQDTRLYSLNICQMMDEFLDEVLWMRTVSKEDAGLEQLDGHVSANGPVA